MAKCLEELKFSKQVVSFLGHDFSLGFIPLGQSIPLIQSYQEMIKMEKDSRTSTQELLMAKVEMVANFCSFIYPHIDQKYILEHAQLAELDNFFVKLIQCVVQELSALNQSGEQAEPAKKKKMSWEQSLDLFCIVFDCMEEYVLHHYNLSAFYRKLSNGIQYRLQLSGLYSLQEDKNHHSSPMSREDFHNLSHLYFDKRRP